MSMSVIIIHRHTHTDIYICTMAGRWNGRTASVRWSKVLGWRLVSIETDTAWWQHHDVAAVEPPETGDCIRANKRTLNSIVASGRMGVLARG